MLLAAWLLAGLSAGRGGAGGGAGPGSWGRAAGAALLGAALNGGMWACHVRALARAPSVEVKVASTAANVLLTGVLGWAAFGEPLEAAWGLGALCLIAGAALILRGGGGGPVEEGRAKGKAA